MLFHIEFIINNPPLQKFITQFFASLSQTPYPKPEDFPGRCEGLIIGATIIIIIILSGVLLRGKNPTHRNVDNE
ncbi:MAG TPA: hypothetical protein G4N95_02170 [Anaerolineae bacterium]|nr:hypothetical protein [Anaerolineae bacterium]